MICDSGSTNGVIVNQDTIEKEHKLKPFDIIRIANTTLIFLGKEIVYNLADPAAMMNSFDYDNRAVIMRINID